MNLLHLRHAAAYIFLAVTLAACGGGGGGGGSNNSPPRFTSPTSFTFPENSPVGFVLTVADADGDTITIREQEGGDGRFFTVNPANGNVIANQTFNYEDPEDADRNNVYEVSVRLSDGKTTVSQTISVTITDADDIPTCSYDGVAVFPENATGLVFTFDGQDEDGPGDYTELRVGPDPIYLRIPDHVYDSARMDQNTGEVFLDFPIDREDPHFSAERIAFTTAYRQNGQLASCRVFVTIEDVPSIVTSGIKMTGPVSMANSVGDIDGDGIEELWLEGARSFDAVQMQVEARLIFGGALSQAIVPTGGASLDLAELGTGAAIRFFTTDVDALESNYNGGGEQLVGRPMGDLDGDGIPELLIAHRPNAAHSRGASQPSPPAAYLIWGRAIVGNTTGEMNLRNLSAPDGSIIRLPTDFIRRGLDVASGDFDGDGIPDLVMGVPEPHYTNSTSNSHTLVIFGPTLMSARSSGQLDLINRNDIVIFTGSNSHMFRAGAHVVAIGDVDEDGLDELLVASQTNQFAIIPGSEIASVPRGDKVDFWGRAAFLETPLRNGGNYAIRRPVDVNNDNIPDLIIAHGNAQGVPTASVVSGSLLRTMLSNLSLPSIVLGQSNAGVISVTNLSRPDLGAGTLASLGDIDGDGLDDFAFGQSHGAPSFSSSLFVLTGRAVSASEGQVFDLAAPRPGDVLEIQFSKQSATLSAAFTSLSDVDGDGLMDIVAVDSFWGIAYVLLGEHIADALMAGETTLDVEPLFDLEPSSN